MPTDSIGTALHRAVSLLAIRELPSRYAVAFDARDEARMLELWAPSVRPVALPDLDRAVVADALIPSWATAGPSVMQVGTQTVEVLDEASACGLSYSLVRIELHGELLEQSVLYRDSYTRGADGVWRFQMRRHHLFYGRSLGESPWGAAPADWPRHQTGAGDLPESWGGVLAWAQIPPGTTR